MSRIKIQLFELICAVLVFTLAAAAATRAQQTPAPQDSFLLTVFLKHDQSKTVDQINERLKRQDYYKKFSAAGDRSRLVVYNDGYRPGSHFTRAGQPFARGQPRH